MTQASAVTGRLVEDIKELEQLDGFRADFLSWRNLARAGLKQFAEFAANPKLPGAQEWNTDLDLDDKALVVKNLCRPGGDIAAIKPLLDELRAQKIKTILGTPENSPLFSGDSNTTPFYTAACGLDALASAPDAVFSPAIMYHYYVVIRELYYPTAPLWTVGGARAGAGGTPTAFTTSQFVRGISSFARMLERSGQYLHALAEMHQTAETEAEAWNHFDAHRRALSLHTTLAQRAWNLAFTIDEPVPRIAPGQDLRQFEAAVRHDLIASLHASVKTFDDAYDEIDRYRNAERGSADTPARQHLIDMSEGAHAIAIRTLEDARDRATKARDVFGPKPADKKTLLTPEERVRFAADLSMVGTQFLDTAKEVQKLLQPALDYLSNVLDHQLARATADTEATALEPFELASAAATLGSVGSTWTDERLLRAARYLGASMTPEGFAIALPYHTGGGSYYLPAQPQVLGAYAQILEHVPAELSPGILNRIHQYFIRNRREIDEKRSSWRWAHAGPRRKHSGFHTAISASALDRLCRMLDQRINDVVFRHFPPRQPKLRLQELFYPDYGLADVLKDDSESKRLPIGVALERMRAHIAGVTLGAPHNAPLYSLVLHGPPGTGKTTLIEALAVSAGVRLVEVTPSDIIVGGADAVEARAHAVLRSLSFLTNAVVLFDEFDPVLQTREEQRGPQSIFTFLTTSMLPKLKRLYESAKDRRVAFALATNILRKLDPAAVRSGRFDATIGVYPPDILSRYGRLYTEVRRYIEERKPKIPAELDARFEEVVLATDRVLMPEVGRPGWFTRPKGMDVQPDTLFGYLFLGGKMPKLSRLEDEGKKRKKGEDLWSPVERKEWQAVMKLETEAPFRQKIALGCTKAASKPL